jgi:hypothetical protein
VAVLERRSDESKEEEEKHQVKEVETSSHKQAKQREEDQVVM